MEDKKLFKLNEDIDIEYWDCKYFYEWDNRYPKCKLKDLGINKDKSLYCNYPNCGLFEKEVDTK